MGFLVLGGVRMSVRHCCLRTFRYRSCGASWECFGDNAEAEAEIEVEVPVAVEDKSKSHAK